MRVLIVNTRMNVYGGAELLIVKLANYFNKKGIENRLLTPYLSPEIEKEIDRRTEIISLGNDAGSGIKDIIKEVRMLQKAIQHLMQSFDVINVHNFPSELSVFGVRKPVVWMCNEPPIFWLNPNIPSVLQIPHRFLLRFERFVVRKYVEKACVSDEFNARRFEKIYGFKPEVINYGIDYEFFSKGNGKRALEEFDLFDNFIILQVGMITPLKNQMESVKVLERLKDKIPNVKLVLAGWGEGEYVLMLKEYIKEKGLEQNVIFTGHLDRECLRDLYHACDVLLHPIKSQGGWLSPFEALCAKKPIVVSTEMTASDIIRREKIGVVTNDFAGAIWDIYNNTDKYQEMAKRGQTWVREHLSWDKFCERMVSLFHEAIKEKREKYR